MTEMAETVEEILLVRMMEAEDMRPSRHREVQPLPRRRAPLSSFVTSGSTSQMRALLLARRFGEASLERKHWWTTQAEQCQKGFGGSGTQEGILRPRMQACLLLCWWPRWWQGLRQRRRRSIGARE